MCKYLQGKAADVAEHYVSTAQNLQDGADTDNVRLQPTLLYTFSVETLKSALQYHHDILNSLLIFRLHLLMSYSADDMIDTP